VPALNATVLNVDCAPPIRLVGADKEFVVFLVDDDQAVLESLTRLLRTAGYRIKAYSSSETFLAEHDASAPGCVVLDMVMPTVNGLDVQRALKLHEIERPIVFLTGTANVHSAVLAMKGGALDVLVKPVKASALLGAIRVAEESDKTSRGVESERQRILALFEKISPREKEVLIHVVAGKQSKEIARTLGISLKTVKAHRGNMMRKMGARSVAELVRMTLRSARELSLLLDRQCPRTKS